MTLLAFPSNGLAQSSDGDAAVDEYVEKIPTSGGDVRSGGPGASSSGGELPADVSSQLAAEGGDDAAILRTIATSSRHGAPDVDRGDRGTPGAAATGGLDAATSSDGALSAAGSAVAGGESALVTGLLVVLALITLAAVAIAGARRARASR